MKPSRTRLARALMAEATDGITHARRQALLHHITTDPRGTATLVIELAELAAAVQWRTREVTFELPDDPNAAGVVLRRAHAAYRRGERTRWAVEGHREYDRRRKQKTRGEAA